MADEWINLIICFGKRDQVIQAKQSSTLKQLYQMVYDKQNNTRIRFEDMRLSFGGQNLERTDETLEHCGLYDRARVVGYLRLSGGATRYIQGRKIGTNVKITSKEDIITLDDDIPTMELPCGHTIAPESLADYIKDQVDSHKTELTCFKCKMKWDLSKIKEMGLTTKEKETMEIGLTENLLYDKYKCKECPQCGLKIEKKDAGFRVMCPLCNNFEFCWNCLRKWIAPGSGYNDCGNVNCNKNDILQVLKSCETTTMAYANISGVPEIRLCPACGEGIGHKSGCKHMTCPRCTHQFCFVCLKKWPCAGSDEDYNKQCKVAPRQTAIPSNY